MWCPSRALHPARHAAGLVFLVLAFLLFNVCVHNEPVNVACCGVGLCSTADVIFLLVLGVDLVVSSAQPKTANVAACMYVSSPRGVPGVGSGVRFVACRHPQKSRHYRDQCLMFVSVLGFSFCIWASKFPISQQRR